MERRVSDWPARAGACSITLSNHTLGQTRALWLPEIIPWPLTVKAAEPFWEAVGTWADWKQGMPKWNCALLWHWCTAVHANVTLPSSPLQTLTVSRGCIACIAASGTGHQTQDPGWARGVNVRSVPNLPLLWRCYKGEKYIVENINNLM